MSSLRFCAAFALSFPLLLGVLPAHAGVADDLKRSLQRLDRSICHEFKGKGCKSAARKKKTARKGGSTTPTAKKPVAKVETAPNPSLPLETAAIPVPRPRPADLVGTPKPVAEVVASIPIPRERPAREDLAPQVPPLSPPVEAGSQPAGDDQCVTRLVALGVDFVPVPTLAATGNCTVTNPVELRSIRAGANMIELPDRPTLNCAFAERFARWVKERGQPAARDNAGSAIAKLYTGPGYQCRGRNGDGSGKLSEHGYGNAVDITLFKLESGRTVNVSEALNPVSPDYAVLKTMRAAACEQFSTVLGPGSNAAHAEHFHFDNGLHGKSGTYRICE